MSDIYADLPTILWSYLSDKTVNDGRPVNSAYPYKLAFTALLAQLVKMGVAYPPTVEQVEAALAQMAPSRLGQVKSAWKWMCKAGEAFSAQQPENPLMAAAAQFPAPRASEGTRMTGRSKHPIGLPVCMWVELLGIERAQTATFTEAGHILGAQSPKTRHDAALSALKAIRHYCYDGDMNVGDINHPVDDPMFRDPVTKKPFTEDDFKAIIKGENLSLPQLKRGYFTNNIVWRMEPDGESYVGCTFQFDVLTTLGFKMRPFEPRNLGTAQVDLTTGGVKYRAVADEPYVTLNDPRNPYTSKNPERHTETYSRAGEIHTTPESKAWWDAYYEFKCPCHNPPEKPKTAAQKWMEEKIGKNPLPETAAMVYANFIGMGAQKMFDPDWKGPKVTEPSSPPLGSTKPNADLPRAPVPYVPEPLPSAPPGRCADCAMRDDPACAQDIAAGGNGCVQFSPAEDEEPNLH